ncbi:MAG: HlyD family efflux transporter periplasmic adaptor subunit [Burkholderiaceae bacterium]
MDGPVTASTVPLAVTVPVRQKRRTPLPAIRDELKLLPAAPNDDGTPAWVIQDPVRNRFYRIGWLEFELLLNWADSDAGTLIRAVNAQTPLNVTVDDVRQLLGFLADNELLRLDGPADVDRVRARHARMRKSPMEWLLHNYLFFRVPLLRPQRWLASVAPWLAWLQTRQTAWAIGLLSLLGLYLVSRQWDTFSHTLVDHLTWSGLVGYALALVVAKTFHELGHAFAATRHGVRVAHMGVAFLVMFPMLYTDTGESWRLKDPRHRLSIASAGMVVELALAGLATLAWSLTPDGALRNGLFFLATTSWLLTLAVNASPFMRFDGYFILSDLLDIPNLHERAGALARTWLRRFLLGFRDSWPESFEPARRRWLIAFALTTWIYRLTVFLGIAVLVYVFFFKVLGLFLMAVELVWFIGKPVMKELKVWYARRGDIRVSRRWVALALLVAGGLMLLLPIQTRVQAHGWLRAEEQQLLYAPFEAQLGRLPDTRNFRTGDVVFALDSRLLGIDQEKARQLAWARERQMAGLLGLPDGESQRQLLASQKALHEAQERASTEQRGRLILRAPFDGELHDLDPDLAEGVWVRSLQPLAMLVNPSRWVVDAFVAEADLSRIAVGQAVRVRQVVDPVVWLDGHIAAIDVARTTALPSAMLDASHGGPLATVPGPAGPHQQRVPVARDALFRVRIALDEPVSGQRLSLVRVQIEGHPQALIDRVLRKVVAVVVRESGF